LRPNAWGLYDVHGNVWEWAQDYPSEYPSGSVINPTGETSGSVRVFRGGACPSFPERLRLAFRHSFPPSLKSHILGFRVVMDL
jgi:sulfatase modifying factor 1